MKKRICTGLVLLLLAGGPAAFAATTTSLSVVGITKPVDDVTMSFAQPVQVSKINVKEGDMVKAGTALIEFDDREELALYKKAKSEAESMTRINVQKAIRDQKQVELEKLQATNEKMSGAVTPWEIDEAKIALEVEKAKLDLEIHNHEQAQLDEAAAKAKLDKLTLVSPIDGRVEKIYLEVGESVESGAAKVIHLERRDPLKVEANVPFGLGASLKKGDTATVVFSDKTLATGKVTFVAGVADPASSTLRVTVELPNAQMRAAGEQVQVSFPQAGGLAARR